MRNIKKCSTAQITAEFFVFLGIAFLISVAVGLSTLNHLKTFRDKNEQDNVKDIGLKLQKELLVAAEVEDGYSRVFTISSKLDNADYSISLQNLTLSIQTNRSYFIVPVPETTGNFLKGINTVNKTGGVIYIN